MLWGILETENARAFKPLPLFSAPLKTSMNEWKPLSTKTCLRNAIISETVNSRVAKPLPLCSKKDILSAKMCVHKMLWGISKTVNARAFKPLPLCSAPLKTCRNERKPLSKLKHVWENAIGYLRKQKMLEISNLCHFVLHPWKLTSIHFWSPRNERKPLSKQNCVLRKCY